MKFFAVFAAVLAIAAAAPSLTTQWTLNDLSEAIQNPTTPAQMLPYLEHALNTMMEQMFAGEHVQTVVVPTPVGLLPVEAASPAGVMPVGVVEAPVESGLTTQWTLSDLSEAIQNPATPAEVLPYLEHALNTMMEQMFAGEHVQTVVVPTPVGLLPVEAVSPAAVMPVGVVDAPIAPIAPEVAAEPTPAVINDASGSPLVQIIVNIRSQEVAAETPAAIEPSPVLTPMPVLVVDEAEVVAPAPVEIAPAPAPVVVPEPSPVEIAPAPAPVVVPEPSPVEVVPVPAPAPIEISPVPEPIVIAPAPAPVEVAPAPAPIVIAPAPAPIVIAPENPIDVIAIATPEVNPIDLLQPVPVAVAGAGGELV